jgi:hypothetical protein
MADGNVTSTSSGKVWTLRISIPNALNVGFIFNQFNLAPTAELYIFNEGRTALDSAIKKAAFTSSTSVVGIAPFQGNSIIIYIIEPSNFGSLQSVVSINNLEAGFQEITDVGEVGSNPSFRPSVNCNPHIQCQQAKLPSARAVARFFSNGRAGTGTLINNENNNGRAYFLTAFHVLDVNKNGALDPAEIAALASARFQFQFWRTTCNGNTNNQFIQFEGAVVRESWQDTDIVLLELSNPPGVGDGVNYAGWSRQTNAPSNSGSYIIHHPQTREMRITSTRNVNTWLWNPSFWTAHYSSGTVDRGSSGSALFNENDQIIGQLRSGWSSCNYTDFGDRYGKFSSSWNAVGLQQWLSPNQGLNSSGSLILSPVTIQGSDYLGCPDNIYSVPNLLGCTYTWAHSPNLTIISGQGTSTVTIRSATTGTVGAGWIRVTINDSKGSIGRRTQTVEKAVTIAAAQPTGIGIVQYNNLELCDGNSSFKVLISNPASLYPYSGTLEVSSQGTPVTWSLAPYASSTNWTWSVSNNTLSVATKQANLYIVLRATATNSCGSIYKDYYFSSGQCLAMAESADSYEETIELTISPNPITNSFDASLKEKSTGLDVPITEIIIKDKFGTAVKHQKFEGKSKSERVNIQNLGTDMYVVQVFDGKKWRSRKIMKQ